MNSPAKVRYKRMSLKHRIEEHQLNLVRRDFISIQAIYLKVQNELNHLESSYNWTIDAANQARQALDLSKASNLDESLVWIKKKGLEVFEELQTQDAQLKRAANKLGRQDHLVKQLQEKVYENKVEYLSEIDKVATDQNMQIAQIIHRKKEPHS